MVVKKKTQNQSQSSEFSKFFIVLLFTLSIPSALLMWFGNLVVLKINDEGEENKHIPPTRWLAAVVIPLVVSTVALKKKSVSQSGAVFGSVVAFILTLGSYCFLAVLLVTFVAGSKATKFKSEEKKKIEQDFKEGGQRNWVQVVCNAGMATVLVLLYILDCGCGEVAINFNADYRASWLSLGVLGALACLSGDTLASELGTTLSCEPFLITTFKRVPKGTNGGVSYGGLLFSMFGGLLAGIAHYICILYYVDKNTLLLSPPQWPVVLIGGLAGLFGSLLDSLLGATMQYSGIDTTTGCIVERAGTHVKYISGSQLLDNHSVNLLATIITGYITPVVANLWL